MYRLVRMRAESRHQRGCAALRDFPRGRKSGELNPLSISSMMPFRNETLTSMSVKMRLALGVEGIKKESIQPFREKSTLESVRALSVPVFVFSNSISPLSDRPPVLFTFVFPRPSTGHFHQWRWVNRESKQIDFLSFNCWESRVRKSRMNWRLP